MGLDFHFPRRTYDNAPHWSYSGFHRFRARLAEKIALDLEAMRGFGGNRTWDHVADPIRLLLNHSDCEGELSAEQCAAIAPRLRELVSDWGDDDFDRYQALLLADAMDVCASTGEPLEFC